MPAYYLIQNRDHSTKALRLLSSKRPGLRENQTVVIITRNKIVRKTIKPWSDASGACLVSPRNEASACPWRWPVHASSVQPEKRDYGVIFNPIPDPSSEWSPMANGTPNKSERERPATPARPSAQACSQSNQEWDRTDQTADPVMDEWKTGGEAASYADPWTANSSTEGAKEESSTDREGGRGAISANGDAINQEWVCMDQNEAWATNFSTGEGKKESSSGREGWHASPSNVDTTNKEWADTPQSEPWGSNEASTSTSTKPNDFPKVRNDWLTSDWGRAQDVETKGSDTRKRRVTFSDPLVTLEKSLYQSDECLPGAGTVDSVYYIKEQFSLHEVMVLRRIAAKLERDRWLTISEGFSAKTGRMITPAQAKALLDAGH